MITGPLIAYGIMQGTIDDAMILFLWTLLLFDSLVWATILYNIRDIWIRKRR